ncbi:MAG: hypothetical protein K2N16_10650 [Muribaculaceae bacterium]|nr:hypothetical protein [Muribaculaceae bacterium]
MKINTSSAMHKILSLLTMALLPILLGAQNVIDNGEGFALMHDITSASITDSRGRDWDCGNFTQNPTVKVSFNSKDPEIKSLRVAVKRCNGMVRAGYTFTLLSYAVADNAPNIDIKSISSGQIAEFDVSIPGRYCLAYCAVDEFDNPIFTELIEFDSLYDDGNWVYLGEALLSSGVLSSENICWHVFYSNGTGFLESPGDDMWWHCPVTYPYYSGETWSAPIDYHPGLKKYRIVNPFSYSTDFKEYLPDDNDLAWALYSNVEYMAEGFVFDFQNPAWFILNAENEANTYCEPTRTGIALMHNLNPYLYIAHPYRQHVGYIHYDVCPVQNLKKSGRYVDMPLDDESEASLIIKFPLRKSALEDANDDEGQTEYFTLDGIKTSAPGKGLRIVKQGSTTKIIYSR